jgi:hypothetical protein
MRKIKLTQAEKELVIKEFAKRTIDLAYMTAEDLAREKVPYLLEHLDASGLDDEFSFNFRVTMCKGDILQVIGRKRRQDGKTKTAMA